MNGVYYNENDRFASEWLRALINAGELPAGDVDDRDIRDVCPDDLLGYAHCHFFAGIGGWPLALRRAGWPDDRPVWTGSCPCQSFSAAGRRLGGLDERHLWPAWFHLIERRRPTVVFGEQVETAINFGWIDLVSDDLEGIAYTVAPVGLPAACVGAPTNRPRLYFVADCGVGQADPNGHERGSTRSEPDTGTNRGRYLGGRGATRGVGLADTSGERRQQDPRSPSRDEDSNGRRAVGDYVAGRDESNGERQALTKRVGRRRRKHGHPESEQGWSEPEDQITGSSHSGVALGDTNDDGPQGRSREALLGTRWRHEGPAIGQSGHSFWSDCDWLWCRDGKSRPVEPGTFPLAHGLPARVGRLRGYGNAIVPQVAQVFIEAYLEARADVLA